MNARSGISAVVISATSIWFGASVGREGPVVHLGATLSSLLARKIGLSRSQTTTLIGRGVAAPSSFNALIAGVFSALEVVIGHYGLSAFTPIVIASVVGTMISRTHFGDFFTFNILAHTSVSALIFPAFALLGILCAFTAVIFMKSVAATRLAAQKIPGPAWWRPMYGGLLIASFGTIRTMVVPEFLSGVIGYTLVGMGAVAGSVLGAPISTILIVFELSADYTLTIAVMIGVVVASVITRQFAHKSFILWQLSTRGIDLKLGRESSILGAFQVGKIMKTDYAAIPASADMIAVRDALASATGAKLIVIHQDQRVLGTLTLPDLPVGAPGGADADLPTAGEIAEPNPPPLKDYDNIGDALQLLHEFGENHVGVVDDLESLKLIGLIHQTEIIVTYNRALLKTRQEDRHHA